MKKPLVYIFCLLYSLPSFAQEEKAKFKQDPEEFAKEIKKKFRRVKRDRADKIVDQFLEYWETGQFTVEEQNTIITTKEMMGENRFQAFPGFENYLFAVNTYKENGISKSKFNTWHRGLKTLIHDRHRYTLFNKTMAGLFEEKALYRSTSKNWYVNTRNYDIKIEQAPVFLFNDIHLQCITPGDTVNIYHTSGQYNLSSQEWEGRGGKVSWERVGYSPKRVYAVFTNPYRIHLKIAEIKADSVKFVNKNIFDFPIWGKLEEKAFIDHKGKDATYPKFHSYKTNYTIENFTRNVTYQGGFTMEGAQFIGTGYKGKKAHVYIKYKGKRKIKALSDLFTIDREKIISRKTDITLYFKEDSIYHPQTGLTFFMDSRELVLTRGNKGLNQSPYYDTYHNMEMEFDLLKWNIDQPEVQLDMTMNSSEPAVFTSDKFFNKEQYRKLQGIISFHPLEALKRVSGQIESRKITDADFASYLDLQPKYVKRLLIRLGMKGYLIYHSNTGEVILKDKIFHYINANARRIDYDNIRFVSIIEAHNNGVLNLESGDLKLEGVGRASLSDSQNVYIFPREQIITVKENCNLKLDGQILAGRFHFYGENFNFNYDSFHISMQNVDSLKLYFPKEETGKLVAVKNVIQDINGTIFIDHPKNKSGRFDYPKFPIFDCKKGAAVYYDRPGIFDGVYDREEFYFQVKPFVVDSLDNFTKKGVRFNGTFYSGGIFPVFDHDLYLMDDLSLGFEKSTPPGGYSLYKGKGRGKLRIRLSNQGLWGSGNVNYLVSTTESKNFLFLLDSMNAHADHFVLPDSGQDKYPPVTGTNTYNHWMPYRDSMYIYQRKEPLYVYNKDISFDGDLILTPDELIGSGIVGFKNAEINSKAVTLKPDEISADSASFRLKSDKAGKSAFYSPNINFKLDLENNVLLGSSNTKEPTTRFQYNKYLTSIKDFRWDVDKNSITLKTPPGQKIKEAYMVSTNPDQDSLKFNTTAAFFDLDNYTIEARNIPYISVANAQLYPPEGEVIIEENAKMRSLENATIKVDTTYFFHTIYRAYINVFGQNKYSAYGYYNYVDRTGSKQKIYFKDIRVGEEGHSVAHGKISDSAQFLLHPKFKFRGDVHLKADRAALRFIGFLHPNYSGKGLTSEWMQFADTVHPDSIYVNVNQAVDANGNSLFTGIYKSFNTGHLYTLLLGKKRNPRDYAIIKSSGLFFYDFFNNKFTVMEKRRLFNDPLAGQKFTYQERKGIATGEGEINLRIENKHIKVRTAGQATYNQNDTTYTLDLLMGIDFPFDPAAMKMASDSILEFGFYRPDTRDDRRVTKMAVSNFFENKKARKSILENINTFGLLNAGTHYQPKVLISDIDMVWNTDSLAFMSDGNIGIASIQETKVNKRLPGGMMFKKTPRRETLRFFFGGTWGNWYYFDLTNRQLKVLSSDLEFNNQVLETFKKYSKGKLEILNPLMPEVTYFRYKFKKYK